MPVRGWRAAVGVRRRFYPPHEPRPCSLWERCRRRVGLAGRRGVEAAAGDSERSLGWRVSRLRLGSSESAPAAAVGVLCTTRSGLVGGAADG